MLKLNYMISKVVSSKSYYEFVSAIDVLCRLLSLVITNKKRLVIKPLQVLSLAIVH